MCIAHSTLQNATLHILNISNTYIVINAIMIFSIRWAQANTILT